MNALIDEHVEDSVIDRERISRLVDHVAKRLELPDSAEVSITFISDDEIHELNLKYRGIDSPTDVLSFECDGIEDDFPDSPDEGLILGDIMISPSVATRQAAEHDSTPAEEIDLLTIHGMLHLCGYDHIDDDEAEEMESLQDSILAEWKTSEAR